MFVSVTNWWCNSNIKGKPGNFTANLSVYGKARKRQCVWDVWPHLQTPPGAVFSHDADVGGVDAGPNKPGQVVKLDIPHLKTREWHTELVKLHL